MTGVVHAETRRRGGWKLVDDAMQAFLERGSAKVDQQANGQVHQPQVRQDLFAVDRCQPLDRLQFYNDPSFDQEIDAKTFVKNETVPFEPDHLLPLDGECPPFERLSQQGFVNGL